MMARIKTTKPPSYWADEKKVERLKALWAQGKSASEIARILGGTSRNAVISKLHRLELSGRSTDNVKRRKPPQRPRRPRVRIEPPKINPEPPSIVGGPDLVPTTLIHITKHREHQCPAIYGEPADGMMCGRARVNGQTYCLYHLSRYLPETAQAVRKSMEPQKEEKELA